MSAQLKRLTDLIPGTLLCIAISGVAVLAQMAEEHWTGRPWIEALVIAILIGAVVRTLFQPGKAYLPGMSFCAKTVLEIAVALLGASISLQTLATAGLPLIISIALAVILAIIASYMIGRALKLPQRMAILVACGNSICGNSAIAAVAPVIKADSEDVASSIAFTAILGVIVVLCLPLLIPVLSYTESQYGVLAGLTVYAVPQVLAATMPVGIIATQIGTLVKLVRVLMLGPVVVTMSLLAPRFEGSSNDTRAVSLPFHKMVPWFIIGFLAMMILRSLGLIPEFFLHYSSYITVAFTIISMAALGLGVDLRTLSKVGGRVTTAVILSLGMLLIISIALIHFIGLA
ncbi:YeiH family protein [Microvirga sp. W0021]|uniref:YeiH family protein n=1 Tax=Hohaiivirga grylli TaxID=3133970 RepID=A0ABV0BMV1_9HYPH